jgi:hypothetical protein
VLHGKFSSIGCLRKNLVVVFTSLSEETPLWFRRVYGGKPKHENFIDRALGIKNSQENTWHFSVGDNLTNVIGFLSGMYLKGRII